MARRIVLADYKQKKRDEEAIEIETEDGTIFAIDPPALWPDEIQPLALGEDMVGMAKMLIGEDKYAAFVAAGGSAAMVGAMVGEELGLDVGES